MFALRDLVFTTYQELELSAPLTETLKWGEPSYVCDSGSTLRMDWQEAEPDVCKVFFHCQTSLIATFRELYPDDFAFDGNRAIKLGVGNDIDLGKLGHCIGLCLRYHELKHLPQLGVGE